MTGTKRCKNCDECENLGYIVGEGYLCEALTAAYGDLVPANPDDKNCKFVKAKASLDVPIYMVENFKPYRGR